MRSRAHQNVDLERSGGEWRYATKHSSPQVFDSPRVRRYGNGRVYVYIGSFSEYTMQCYHF